MTPQSIGPQRIFRLQFSLRMLLLLTAMVAMTLTIFRWPWETTILEMDIARTTRYRRGWNGMSLKHGTETVVNNQLHKKISEALYEDGVLRRERSFDTHELLSVEKIYFPERGETLERSYGINHDRSIIAETKSLEHGLRLRHEWRTIKGNLLESNEYERKYDNEGYKLVRWNDRLGVDAFKELLSDLPPSHQELWLMHTWISNYSIDSYLGDSTFRFSAGLPLHVCSPDSDPEAGLPPFRRGQTSYFLSPSEAHIPLIQELLSHAHARHQTLQCRFGVICMVPIHADNMTIEDLTGALSVRFEEGSPQSSAWLDSVHCMDQHVVPHAKRLQQFFANTGIEIDASQITLPVGNQPTIQGFDWPREPNPSWSAVLDLNYRRTRRDTLGMFLWNHRLQVKQQGNKLIILPHDK